MLKSIFSSLIFWKYYFEKKGSIRRDQKLISLTNLIPSNLILFFALFIFTMWLLTDRGTRPYYGSPIPFFIVYLLIAISQLIFQMKSCINAYKRISGIQSIRMEIKEFFVSLHNVSSFVLRGLAGILVDELQNILDEFFNGYEENKQAEQQNNSYSNQYHEQNRQHSYNQREPDIESKIIKIFNKYDIPQDSQLKEIKKRFRLLAKKYHPDMPTGDQKKFIELREDLEFLINYLKTK